METAYGTAGEIATDHATGALRATTNLAVGGLGRPLSRPGTPDRARAPAKERAYFIAAFLWAADLVVAGLAVFAGLGWRASQRGEAGEFIASFRNPFTSAESIWVLGGALLFSWLMVAMKTYDVRNLYRMSVWARNLVKGVFVWLAVALAVVALVKSLEFAPRAGLLYCVGALFAAQTGWRLLAYVFLVQPQVRHAASRRVVIVGWNDTAAALREAARFDAGLLTEIVGCVPAWNERFETKPPAEVPVLGPHAALREIVQECGANALVLVDATTPAAEIRRLIAFGQRELLGFQMVPTFFPALVAGLQVETMGGVPLLGVTHLPLDSTINRIGKRAFDVAGALVGLVLTAPVIAAFGALVRCESRGPIFYRQLRTSRSGRSFHIWKIRSMRVDAEKETGAVWCTRDDPRRLRIGAFMRRWNIDELPQFWNVLKGDMSLVGPRPERPELIERFKDEIPNYNARHEVRAGLTGWAQIHGYRGDTDLRKRIEHDLYYLENWSPMLDLYCVVATLFSKTNAH